MFVDAIAELIGGSAWSIGETPWSDEFKHGSAWSIGGTPWSDEFEDALEEFMAKFNALVDAAPAVAEVLDQPLRPSSRLRYFPPEDEIPF